MSDPGATRPANAEPSIGRLVSDISRDMSTLVRGEIALAKSELRVSVKSGATGIGMLVAVAVLMLFVIGMLSMAGGFFFAWVFDNQIPLAFTWGFLIMTGVWVLIVLIVALIGIRLLKKVKAPEKTIATVQEIPAALKGHGDTSTEIVLPASAAASVDAAKKGSGKHAK